MRVFGTMAPAFFCLIAVPTASFAQDCSPLIELDGVEFRDEYKSLRNRLRQLTARADMQAATLDDLDEGRRGILPALAAPPELPAQFVNEADQLVWSCGADGTPEPDFATLRTALNRYSAGLDDFEASLYARETALLDAEGAADGLEDGSGDTASTEVAMPSEPEAPDADAADEPTESGDGGVEVEVPNRLDVSDAPAAEPDPTPARAEPIPDATNPNLYRRVLSMPAATLRREPRAAAAEEPLPTFSVLYVFDESAANGGDWLKVGPSLRGEGQGWIAADETLDWSSMLVMSFAPKGKRSDVLFFDDATALGDIVRSFSYEAEISQIYESLAVERQRLSENPDAQPDWDDRLVAIEPPTGVSFGDNPYLLPILDHREELLDGSRPLTMLKVAAVPADAETVAERDSGSLHVDMSEAAANDDEFRVGVVFVVDTSISMRPFIERTHQAIRSFYDSFQRYESASFVSFGLVGFRDEIKTQPDVEYVTRSFQPLDPDAPPEQILTNMEGMREATAPTMDFREDVFAGVIDAIEGNDWSPFDARIVVLVTDASARTGDDPLARFPNTTPQSVQERARNQSIAIVPLHLRTEANSRNGDVVIGETQYRILAETGDINNEKYFQLNAVDDERFFDELDAMTSKIARNVFRVNAGEFEPVPEASGEGEAVGAVAAAVSNELFRAQLESLGDTPEGGSPSFLAGWTVDRDLLDPAVRTLEVSVFLTRNQLSSLDKQLGVIIDAFRSGGDDPQAFFDRLQQLAAETATDPNIVRADDRAVMREILPTFLRDLPYTSEVLGLDRGYWMDFGQAGQAEFIEQLEAKRKIYADIFGQTDLWQDFGADDPLLQVTPVRLSVLP